MERIEISIFLHVISLAFLTAISSGELNTSNGLNSNSIFNNENLPNDIYQRSRTLNERLYVLTESRNSNDVTTKEIYTDSEGVVGESSELIYSQIKNSQAEHCSKGSESRNDCDRQNMRCRKVSNQNGYECKGCLESFFPNGSHCLVACSNGTKWYNACEKENRDCIRLEKSPFGRCGECKDGYVLKRYFLSNICVEHCGDGTDSEKNCSYQNRVCEKLKKKPYFKCGKCKSKFQEAEKQCVKFCDKGTPSEKICSAINRNCQRQSSKPYFKCDKCKIGYETLEDVCVEYCTNGTLSEKKCSDQNKICETGTKEPFFNCSKCFDGYILKDGECIEFCGADSPGYSECSASNKECHVIKQPPFYRCKSCLKGYTNLGEKCVEYCTEGTNSEKNCTVRNRVCQKEQQSPFFKCGSCKTGFVKLEDQCIAYCSNGTESEKHCTSMNKTCEQKREDPFYSCGKCKQGFGESSDKCLDHCFKGLRGDITCRRQNKICKPITTGLYYNCTECIFGYISNGKYCEDPCEEGQEGWANCSSIGRECIFNPGAKYECGLCNSSDWIEDGERCIDPCEKVPPNENSTWSEICKNSNATCKYNHILNVTDCLCYEENKAFNLKNKLCESACDQLFPSEENVTWSEVCENANATCKYDYTFNKTNCVCHDDDLFFDMSTQSCLYSCSMEINGITWSQLCSSINAVCVTKENKADATCKCIQPEEAFDDQTKTCKELHPCDFPGELFPCRNNGTCESISEKDFKCHCNDAWYGKHCEHRNLCIDNAFCYPATCSMNEKHHSYICICEDDEYFNYENKTCEKIACLTKSCPDLKECQNGSCICKKGFEEENGTCKMTDNECEKHCGRKNVKCVNVTSPTEFTCVCKEGYYLNPISSECEASLCVFPFHSCQQVCNHDGDQLCGCHEGFSLVNNSNCEPKEENACDARKCENGACKKENEGEVCVCNDGFEEINGSCTDICSIKGHDKVQSVCPNACKYESGEVKCICTGKYTQAPDGISCIEKDYCQKGHIGENECQKVHKVCTKHNEDPWYKCTCPEGQRDDDGTCTDSCSIQRKAECALTHRTCLYASNNETCHCPLSMIFDEESDRCQFANEFYHVTLDVKIEQAEENMLATDSKEIFQKAVTSSMKILYGQSLLATDVVDCRRKGDFHTCTFSLIFEENADGIKNRLKDEQSCKELPNVTEYCIFPYHLVVSKESLLKASLSSNKCDENVRRQFCSDDTNICTPLPPGFTCLCKPGFHRVSSFILGYDERYKYQTCEDIDECKNNPCWGNSMCKNTVGSFTCNCEIGYVLNESEDGCKGVCDGNPCGNNGKCELFGDHDYICKCNKGYKGKTCMEEDTYLQSYNLYTVLSGSVLGCMLLISLSAMIALAIKLYRVTHESYDLKGMYKNYEILTYSDPKEYNGKPLYKEDKA